MKRSEMITKLEIALNCDDEIRNGEVGEEYIAEVVLKVIEKAGMLPPPSYVTPISMDAEKGFVMEIDYYIPQDTNGQFNMWEKENE